MNSDKRTKLVDKDGDWVEVDALDGAHARKYGEGLVAVEVCEAEDRATAFVPARELIDAIVKAADLDLTVIDNGVHRTIFGANPAPEGSEPIGHVQVKVSESKPLWTEVRERPARAVKVTPDLVRDLATRTTELDDLADLKPKFSAQTGEPKGVEFYEPRGCNDVLVKVGQVVVLRHGQVPQRMELEDFEQMYEEVAA